MSLVTKRKLVFYLTPLVVACFRIERTHIERTFESTAAIHRYLDPTHVYVVSLAIWLFIHWMTYLIGIIWTASIVSMLGQLLGWVQDDESGAWLRQQLGLEPDEALTRRHEMDAGSILKGTFAFDPILGIVTLTWLVITPGG